MTTNIYRAAEVLWENAGQPIFGTSVVEHGGWDDLSGTAPLPFTSAARALHEEGLLMPDGMSTQTETVGPYVPEDEDMPDLPEANDASFHHPTKGWVLGVQGRPVVWSAPGVA